MSTQYIFTTYKLSRRYPPDKVVLSVNSGPWEAQLTGDYIGTRYATYTNDQSVGSTGSQMTKARPGFPANSCIMR